MNLSRPAVSLLGLALLVGMSYSAIVGRCKKERKSNRCSGANAFWQYDGICVDDANPPTCHVPDSRHFSLKLVAAVDQMPDTAGALPVKTLWLRGSGPGLTWEKPVAMTRVKDGYWTLGISYTYDSNALLCLKESRCTLNQKALEFRVYRDEHGKDGMFGPNIYINLPISNSISGQSGFSPPYVYFYPWFDGKRVYELPLVFPNHGHHQYYENWHTHFTAFFPPSYKHNTLKRYPVVITFGKNLKTLIMPLLESLFVHESSTEEAIVISIHNWHKAPYCEYNPFSVLEADPSIPTDNHVYKCTGDAEVCTRCMSCLNPDRVDLCDIRDFAHQAQECHYRGFRCHGRAEAILDTIEDVILPEMTLRTLGRIMTDYPKERISIVGIDGGGLLACYAALSRPMVYKNAACISASFHWPIRSLIRKESRKKQGIGILLDEITERMKLRPEFQVLHATQKYYIDVGEYDNRYLPIIDAHNYSDWVVEQLESRLKIDPENILYYKKVLGGGNNVQLLREIGDNRILDRIKLPLLFFLKPEGGLNAEYPRTPKISIQDYTRRSDNFVIPEKLLPEGIVPRRASNRSCREIFGTNSKRVSVPVYLLSIGELFTH